ncbi:MAG: sulfatase-like hydrolase/transferase [Chitinivibrionales bacterium]|nr:sulfatase-like hydrolase/transferase [Chitinivibrionales bacterium]
MSRKSESIHTSRRSFLGTALKATIAGSALHAQSSFAARGLVSLKQQDSRPNILFCVSDDQSWPHAGAYGCEAISTPAFDQVAEEGILFNNAFCTMASCAPSRAAILSGQMNWRMIETASFDGWGSVFDSKHPVYPHILQATGYEVGYTGKGWAPGDESGSGWAINPAGPQFNHSTSWAKPISYGYHNNFRNFLTARDTSKPFCFWFGSKEPHRPYGEGRGIAAGMDPSKVEVPPFLPDNDIVRSDILDYMEETQHFDSDVQKMLTVLMEAGGQDVYENTIIVVTSDNGMPFPRAKHDNYEYSMHMPLAIRWGTGAPGGRVIDDLISFQDFAPTFLEAAGVDVPAEMSGRSFLDILKSSKEGTVDSSRDRVFWGKEKSETYYPNRAMRTKKYLYMRNYETGETPAKEDGYSPTSRYMIDHKNDPEVARLHDLWVGNRPAEELYDIENDPGCLVNLAENSQYADIKEQLAYDLNACMCWTDDPRAVDCNSVNAEQSAVRHGSTQQYAMHLANDPARSLLTITLPDNRSNSAVSVFNSTGKKVTAIQCLSGKGTWNYSPATRGTYYVEAINNGRKLIQRIIIR